MYLKYLAQYRFYYNNDTFAPSLQLQVLFVELLQMLRHKVTDVGGKDVLVVNIQKYISDCHLGRGSGKCF